MVKISCCGNSSSIQKSKPHLKKFTRTASRLSSATVLPSAGSGNCCQGGNPELGATDARKSDIAQKPWVLEMINTPDGKIPRVSTRLGFRDIRGSWKCRWSIGRMDYTVSPGLYCAGSPDDRSPVLVTSNYKMTFDSLRKELTGIDAWILVLDTDGINVWCAAGKGTFGTKELVRRIRGVHLGKIVSHREVIVPQLGATGIAAHDVVRLSGFRVVFGPVRAGDLKDFLAAGKVASEDMRTVKFPVLDRLALTPMEFVGALKPLVIVFGILFILNAVGLGHFGWIDFIALLGAVVAGCIITPVLLPWIPGRAFSFKGFVIGILWAFAVNLLQGFPYGPDFGWLKAIAFFLVIPAISAFCAMNFTGSSTYTSLSGVDREMKIALPAMILAAAAGIVLILVGDFIQVLG